jgi:hypothetical protein
MNIEKAITSLINNKLYQSHGFTNKFNEGQQNRTDTCCLINSAFIISLSGSMHTEYQQALKYLEDMKKNVDYGNLVKFYLNGLALIKKEISNKIDLDTDFKQNIKKLNKYKTENNDFSNLETINTYWSVFFPEAAGIFQNKEERSKELRKLRTVKITNKNPEPLNNPGKQLIFTSNILITIPDSKTDINTLNYSEDLKKGIKLASGEIQAYYYDHPILIGTAPEANEIIYGLNGLNNTAEYEKKSGNMDPDQKLTCILSASVTHRGLQKIAKKYIKEEINNYGKFEHLDIYVFTEEDTKKLIDEIFSPSAGIMDILSSNKNTVQELLKTVFGVDGEYGRHYSFLKAVTAFWNILIDADKTATFKIDLDQIFPENALKKESGKSAFEHFKSELWGAEGIDSTGNKVELGMIAGALVNEKDIHKGLFTPDVVFDERQDLKMEEIFFYSKLMMGLSTGSELTTRYGMDEIDGKTTCIQRIHVTGGTNGILIKSLKKHRPFTPGFIGRAEDQAYILSVLGKNSTGLAYLHEDGLIMRHDKEAFAGDAMKAASAGNMIGDFIRTLYFSRYAEILSDNISDIKKKIDPFTGCFVSKIPITTVMLRFCMKATDLFEEGKDQLASDFMLQSYQRLEKSIEFSYGKDDLLLKAYNNDREGWKLYYDILDGIENSDLISSIKRMSIKVNAAGICARCKI